MNSYVFRGIAIPDNIKDKIDDYVAYGSPVGGFLESVISNDLCLAIHRADAVNLYALPAIVGYLYNECDARCWGNTHAYLNWVDKKHTEREQNACQRVGASNGTE